jgi:divinyl protochlorophyllide a 8-vinyl-reductase
VDGGALPQAVRGGRQAATPPAARPAGPGGLIGPNAILQLVPVLDRAGGAALREAVLEAAGLRALPDGTAMIAEAEAARLHQALRRVAPGLAPELARAAGRRTGDYILANRIPAPAQRVLKALPAALAAPLLTRAIARHAWTFAGSGRFEVVSRRPLTFAIHDNPLVRGEHADRCLCHWHAAVFERLFRVLVDPNMTVRETACAACGDPACTFAIG